MTTNSGIDNTINYLDDSDYSLSSDEDQYGYFTDDDEFNETPLIDSIKNKEFNKFLKLLSKNNLKELIFDNELEMKINPLQVALKFYTDFNDINYITKLLETKYYNINDCILFSVFHNDCYNYFKNINKDMYTYIDSNNDNILLWASKYSNLKIVYDIYDNIENHNLNNNQGLNCFLSAAQNQDSQSIFEIINFFIDKNKNNFINSIDKNKDNFLFLLENNINVKANDTYKSIIVKLLVNNGININNINNQGKNILITSIENSNFKNWKSIYDYTFFYIISKIDLNIYDYENDSVLNHCIYQLNNELKLITKKNFNLLKKEFKYFRNIINLIIENKELTNNEMELLKEFKKSVSNYNLI